MSTLAAPRVEAPEPRIPAGRARSAPVWLAIVAASLPMFMATLDNLVMTSALPVVQAHLGSSVGQLSWFLNAYTLAFATFMLPAATLGDRLGRRRMMLAGVALFTAASIGSALSTTSGALITARAFQGLATGPSTSAPVARARSASTCISPGNVKLMTKSRAAEFSPCGPASSIKS